MTAPVDRDEPHDQPRERPDGLRPRALAAPSGPAPLLLAAGGLPLGWEPPARVHRRVWGLLVRRRATLALVLLGALGLALALGLLRTPVYRGSVLIQIDPPESAASAAREAAGAAPARDEARAYHETQIALLQSRTLVRRVIDQLDLGDSPALEPPGPWPGLAEAADRLRELLRLAQPGPGHAAETQGPAAASDLEDRFLARLSVTPVAQSRLVRVGFDSPDPEEAAAVVQTLAENFVTGALKRRHQASAPARAFLEYRVRRARSELADAERRLSAFAREVGIIDLKGQHDLLLERLRALETARTAAESARLAPDADPRPRGDPAADGAATPVQALQARKAELTAEVQEALKVFKPGYPKVAQLRRQLAELERRLRAESDSAEAAARAAAGARVQSEARLTARAEAIKAELLDLGERGNGYRVLEREVEGHRRVHEGLLARLAEVRARADPGPNPIAIIDRAQVPARPLSPDLRLNLGLAAVLGLLAGLVLAWFRDALDDRVQGPAEVERYGGLPVLGLVPRGAAVRTRRGAAERAVLSAWREPTTPAAEAFRSLRTALQFASPEGAPRVMHFTSAAPREGKTAAACATAVAFAETGARVLLIDANIRRPSLHRLFGLPNGAGLAAGLDGTAAVAGLPQASRVPHLWVLTGGAPPERPAELLSGPRLGALIDELAAEFDHLILDGPPVSDLADAVLLAHQADASLLTVTLGTTRLSALVGALRRLRGAGGPLLGAVLLRRGR